MEFHEEWEERHAVRRERRTDRSPRVYFRSRMEQDRESVHESVRYRRSPLRRSRSVPGYAPAVHVHLDSNTYRSRPSREKTRKYPSLAISDSDDSFDALSSLEVSEEEDDPSSSEPEEESEEEDESDEKEESSDEVEEERVTLRRLAIPAASHHSDDGAAPANLERISNWLSVHHPAHSVSAPSSPTYRRMSPTRSATSPGPVSMSRSVQDSPPRSPPRSPVVSRPLQGSPPRSPPRPPFMSGALQGSPPHSSPRQSSFSKPLQGSPPRGPPRPPRIIIGSDGEDGDSDSSSDGMSIPLPIIINEK